MKFFVTKRITALALRQEISRVAKTFGVSVLTFNNKGKRIAGSYNAETKSMYLCTTATKKEILVVFFHELGHHVAVKQNKWMTYHMNRYSFMCPYKIFDIENSIDKIAEKLWNKHVDQRSWGKYTYSYPKKRRRELINSLNLK